MLNIRSMLEIHRGDNWHERSCLPGERVLVQEHIPVVRTPVEEHTAAAAVAHIAAVRIAAAVGHIQVEAVVGAHTEAEALVDDGLVVVFVGTIGTTAHRR